MEEHNNYTGAVFTDSPYGILVLNAEGKITHLNSSLSELVNLTPLQLIGHDSESLPFDTHKGLFKGEGVMHLSGPEVGLERWLQCSIREEESGTTKFFVDITDQVNLEQENERLYRQVKQLTLTDELTGLANQLELSRALNAQVTRSRRYGNPLCLAMMEVIDERAPEQALPDELVLAASRYLRDRLRWVDVIARRGHSQFVVILPETNHLDGHSLISKIQEDFPAAQQHNPLEGESLTLRFGITEWKKGHDARLLMQKAAVALTGEQEQIEQAS
ncbi:MAG: diguanylate cyclase [Sedimenticola sp.]